MSPRPPVVGNSLGAHITVRELIASHSASRAR